MAMVGGQSRCDGWTVRYETVVGYFELEHLLREREEGGGSRICPLCSSAAHKCPKQCGQRCQLGGREGVAEIRQGAGRSQRPGGAGSGADISISQSPCLTGKINLFIYIINCVVSGEIYTAGKKFTLPPAVTALTNINSGITQYKH